MTRGRQNDDLSKSDIWRTTLMGAGLIVATPAEAIPDCVFENKPYPQPERVPTSSAFPRKTPSPYSRTPRSAVRTHRNPDDRIPEGALSVLR